MEEHNGENPQNARINIKYTGKKPKVRFSYPLNKKDALNGNMLFPILFIWLILNFPLLTYIGSKTPEFPFKNLSEYNKTDYNEFVSYFTQKERTDYYYKYYNTNPFLRDFISRRGLFLFYLFISPFIIYFPFRKSWDKLYPDYQALISSKKYRKFTSKDMIERDGEIYVELPIFNNVICDFNAIEEFSKYLKEFDIREYNFYYYRKKRLNSTKKMGRKKNEFLWYARWYFDKIPREGFLEVIFK